MYLVDRMKLNGTGKDWAECEGCENYTLHFSMKIWREDDICEDLDVDGRILKK